MPTREQVRQLVDELPESTLPAAEAFLAFLRDRAGSARPSPGRFDEQRWAEGKRRGLANRRRGRDAAGASPENDGTI